jgi:hypothetical protein
MASWSEAAFAGLATRPSAPVTGDWTGAINAGGSPARVPDEVSAQPSPVSKANLRDE